MKFQPLFSKGEQVRYNGMVCRVLRDQGIAEQVMLHVKGQWRFVDDDKLSRL
jgi:hypothetical protein